MTATLAGRPIAEYPNEVREAAARQRAEAAILHYGRVETFHPLEADEVYLALADALVVLEERGVETLATFDVDPKLPVPEVWRHVKQLARRTMLACHVPWTKAYFYAYPPCDGTRRCACPACR